MNRVFKYKLPTALEGSTFHLPIPPESKCLLIAMQRQSRVAWFEVDIDRLERRPGDRMKIEKVGTGGHARVELGWTHLGSLMDNTNATVWHYYERPS